MSSVHEMDYLGKETVSVSGRSGKSCSVHIIFNNVWLKNIYILYSNWGQYEWCFVDFWHYFEVLVCLGNVTVEIWLTNDGFIFNETWMSLIEAMTMIVHFFFIFFNLQMFSPTSTLLK